MSGMDGISRGREETMRRDGLAGDWFSGWKDSQVGEVSFVVRAD